MQVEKVNYDINWKAFKRGWSFFIPCLDVEAVKNDGLKQARLRHRLFYAKAIVGIKDGLIGVWFYL